MARLAAALSVALGLMAALPAAAQTYGVRFQNYSGATVYSIETSPTHESNWGGDQLGQYTLSPGQHLDLTIHNVSNCYYDVRITFTSGASYTDVLDVCAYNQYNIR